MSLTFHSFNQINIGQRSEDGYLNATAMCKATGKLIGHYLENQATQSFLGALSSDIGIPISGNSGAELVQSRKGGTPSEQGTWVHPYVAVNLAQWCSPEFAVFVSKLVHAWMTGDAGTDSAAPINQNRIMRRVELENQVRISYLHMKRNQQRLRIALSQLRSEKLWQDIADAQGNRTYENFPDYCKRSLGIEKSMANELALAGDIWLSLQGVPDDWRPQSSSALAELNKVPVEERAQILGQLADEAKAPTAFNIKQAMQSQEALALAPSAATEPVEEGDGKIPVTVYMYPELKEQVEELARTEQLSFSSFVAHSLHQFLKARG